LVSYHRPLVAFCHRVIVAPYLGDVDGVRGVEVGGVLGLAFVAKNHSANPATANRDCIDNLS
jgi:hypothetical protein